MYARVRDPKSIPLPIPNEGVFCSSLEYLSPFVKNFVKKYFHRCQWKGHGLGYYEQGPRYVIDIYYHQPKEKTSLGYNEKSKNQSTMKIVNLELEILDYEELVQDYEWESSQSETKYEISIPKHLFSYVISINMVQIEEIIEKKDERDGKKKYQK